MNMILMKVVVGIAASALISGIAIAQNTEEVKVQTKRVMNTKIVGSTASGLPIIEASVTYGVSVKGLDLASDVGAAELQKRVGDAARAACQEIGREYPHATPSEAECANAAADRAMVKVRELVAAAHGETPGR